MSLILCRTCEAELIPGYKRDGGNWPPSRQEIYDYQCSDCQSKYTNGRNDKTYHADWRRRTGKHIAANNRYKEAHPEFHLESHRQSAAKRRALQAENGPVDDINWRAVWGRDEGHCRVGLVCNRDFVPFEEMHLDHVIPITLGGTHTWNNVQTSCAPCNLSKGSRMFEEVMP